MLYLLESRKEEGVEASKGVGMQALQTRSLILRIVAPHSIMHTDSSVWLCGCVVGWLCGWVAVWLGGYVAVWLGGCVAV